MTESDYSNNIAQNVFKWEDAVSLQAAYIRRKNTGSHFESMQYEDFDFAIANYGSAWAAAVDIEIYVNDLLAYETTLSNFPSGKILSYTLPLSFSKSGIIALELVVDPEETTGDIDYSDNTASSGTYTVTYDTELWPGYWEDASNLTTYITPSALDYLETKSLDFGEVRSCIEDWNGISSNMEFEVIESSSDLEDEQNENCVYLRFQEEYKDDETLAVANNYTYWSDGSFSPIPGSLVESYETEYISSSVVLFKPGLDKTTSSKVAGTLRHEFGHVIGLKHPRCHDMSVMAHNVNLSTFSPTLTGHDEYNVIRKYGQ